MDEASLAPAGQLLWGDTQTKLHTRLPQDSNRRGSAKAVPATGINESAAEAFLGAAVASIESLTDCVAGYGLTLLDWRVLVAVAARDGVRVAEIAAAVGRSAPQTTNSAIRLVSRGWLIADESEPPTHYRVTHKASEVLPYPAAVIHQLQARLAGACEGADVELRRVESILTELSRDLPLSKRAAERMPLTIRKRMLRHQNAR